jgi:hypothetical protein
VYVEVLEVVEGANAVWERGQTIALKPELCKAWATGAAAGVS